MAIGIYSMKQIILILSLFCWQATIAQNLIVNPSFEEYDHCPASISFLFEATNWKNSFFTSTLDYYNSNCDFQYIAGQWDISEFEIELHDGKAGAFAKLYHNVPFVSELRGPHRDYIEGELTQQLVAGKAYYFSIWVYQLPFYRIGDNFGIYLTSDRIEDNPPQQYIDVQPTLEWRNQFPELEAWTQLSGCFIADGGEQFITLGGFHKEEDINFIYNDGGRRKSYGFLMDDLELYEIPVDLEITIGQSMDTICTGECIQLSSNNSVFQGTFNWDLPGSDLLESSDSIITVCYSSAGDYDVSLSTEFCGGSFQKGIINAIHVVDAIDYDFPWKDTLVCQGKSVEINLSNNPYNVEWADGSLELNRQLYDSGEYVFYLSIGSCLKEYHLNIQHSTALVSEEVELISCSNEVVNFLGVEYNRPDKYSIVIKNTIGCDSIVYELDYEYYAEDPIKLKGNLGFCPGESTQLEVISKHHDIEWSNASAGQEIRINQAGTYQIEAVDQNGCQQLLSIEIIEYPVPQVIGGALSDIWYQEGIDLPVSYIGQIEEYLWSNAEFLDCEDCPQPQLVHYHEGDFEVIVKSENGCRASGIVRVDFINAQVYVPSTIAMDANEAKNSSLYLQSDLDITYDLKVFDRWGGVRFDAENLTSNNASLGWNPTDETQFNRSAVNPGVFLYLISYHENGSEVILVGDVTVVR